MNSLALIVLLITCAISYGLSCLTTDDGERLKIRLEDFDYDDLIDKLDHLIPMDYDNDNLCRVEFDIDFIYQFLVISFSGQFRDKKLGDRQVLLDTFVYKPIAKDFGVAHIIEYACCEDECEKRFIIYCLDWL